MAFFQAIHFKGVDLTFYNMLFKDLEPLLLKACDSNVDFLKAILRVSVEPIQGY